MQILIENAAPAEIGERSTLLVAEDADVFPERNFNFNHPENVLVHVLFEASTYHDELLLHQVAVLDDGSGIDGYATYDHDEGMLEFELLQGLSKTDFAHGEGWYVIQSVTGAYFKGDGWMTDDDSEIYLGEIRPATDEECAPYKEEASDV